MTNIKYIVIQRTNHNPSDSFNQDVYNACIKLRKKGREGREGGC